MPVPDLPEGWGGFSGAKVNVDIRTTIAHPDCHSKNSPGEALRPCYTVISRKTADTSRATVHHTTLETACKPALALGMHAEDLLENDARESIDKWHGPAIPGIQEQHERDRRPDGIGPKGCRASSPFGSGDMEFKPLEPFEPFDWNNEEEDETEKDIKGKKKGKGSDGMGLRTPMPSEPSLFMFPRPNHCRCVFTWPPPILPHAKEPHLPLIESEFLQPTNRSAVQNGWPSYVRVSINVNK